MKRFLDFFTPFFVLCAFSVQLTAFASQRQIVDEITIADLNLLAEEEEESVHESDYHYNFSSLYISGGDDDPDEYPVAINPHSSLRAITGVHFEAYSHLIHISRLREEHTKQYQQNLLVTFSPPKKYILQGTIKGFYSYAS